VLKEFDVTLVDVTYAQARPVTPLLSQT